MGWAVLRSLGRRLGLRVRLGRVLEHVPAQLPPCGRIEGAGRQAAPQRSNPRVGVRPRGGRHGDGPLGAGGREGDDLNRLGGGCRVGRGGDSCHRLQVYRRRGGRRGEQRVRLGRLARGGGGEEEEPRRRGREDCPVRRVRRRAASGGGGGGGAARGRALALALARPQADPPAHPPLPVERRRRRRRWRRRRVVGPPDEVEGPHGQRQQTRVRLQPGVVALAASRRHPEPGREPLPCPLQREGRLARGRRLDGEVGLGAGGRGEDEGKVRAELVARVEEPAAPARGSCPGIREAGWARPRVARRSSRRCELASKCEPTDSRERRGASGWPTAP